MLPKLSKFDETHKPRDLRSLTNFTRTYTGPYKSTNKNFKASNFFESLKYSE